MDERDLKPSPKPQQRTCVSCGHVFIDAKSTCPQCGGFAKGDGQEMTRKIVDDNDFKK